MGTAGESLGSDARPAIEPRRVLVGVDFSEGSLAAAEWTARRLVPGVELVLVHAIYVPEPPAFLKPLYPPVEPLVDAARAGAEQKLRTLGQSIATGLIWPEVRVGAPDEIIARVAEEYGVDLIVLGRHGERAGARERFGTTPLRVLRRVSVPVLMAPDGNGDEPRQLLVALDGSDVSRAVLTWADRLLGRYDASATIVHVVVPPATGWAPPALTGVAVTAGLANASRGDELTAATHWLEAQRQSLVWHERATTTALVGRPATEILREAERRGSDLIVLGDRGAGAAGRLLFGSVAEAVVRAARCAVLVVKSPVTAT